MPATKQSDVSNVSDVVTLSDAEMIEKIEKIEKQRQYHRDYKSMIRNRRLVTFNGVEYVQYEKRVANRWMTKIRRVRKDEQLRDVDTSAARELESSN